MYCLDASVITNSVIEREEYHKDSKALLLKIRNENIPVVLPEIIVPEVASALSRGTGNAKLSLQFAAEIRKIPNFVFIPIDAEISNLAAKIAAENQMRGADSIYTAIALVFNVRLVTLDTEQLKKSKSSVNSATPFEELRE
ncbi:type II toxin-antitoxin system VapC family toxin [Candidatus Woesearchaeota archaeon]|nr:type II toxin-antitoxin system VapC family toxin [Candidatus Woesearchaeota archaeon]